MEAMTQDPAHRLKKLRLQLGLSQREMAAEFGVSPGALAMWEKSTRPIPGMALKMLEVYEESIDEELALKKHEAVIRKLSSSWASRMMLTFGSGARKQHRAQIKSEIEGSLGKLFRRELSRNRIQRNIQIATFNRIVHAASQTKGLPMKAVQVMTYLNPGMSLESRKVLEQIYNLQHPMAPTLVAKIFAENFGASPSRLFAEWEAKPFATASIGQVHRARLKTGERVAVKIQYPDIQKSLNGDLKALRFLTELASLYNADIRKVMDDIKEVVLKETDYYEEADNLQAFAEACKGDPDILIPRVHRQFSSHQILTMDYIEGRSLEQFKKAPVEDREKAARTIARFATISTFKNGLLNTDSHRGNYIFCKKGQVGFIDFGRVAKSEVVQDSHAQADMLKAVIRKDYSAAYQIFKNLDVIKDPASFPFEELWAFFLNQQGHLHAGPFHFTREYIAKTLQATKSWPHRKKMKITVALVWDTSVAVGLWNIFAELDVRIDYGKISLETLG